MTEHQRPFVLMMSQNNRHELSATVKMMAEALKLTPIMLDATDETAIKQHIFEKERILLVLVESAERHIPADMQTLILERYQPAPRDDREIGQRIRAGEDAASIRASLPKVYPPAGLLVVTDTDPGELCQNAIWTPQFTALKHFTLRWDNLPQRPDAYLGLFRAGLAVAAKDLKVKLEDKVDDKAAERYAWMQKILASHAKKARERGMLLQAHQNVNEVMDAARDCVSYIAAKPSEQRCINTDVIEALVFKGVTAASLAVTFHVEQARARKSRPSFGPDAPYIGRSVSNG
jgi:hypothetical protein